MSKYTSVLSAVGGSTAVAIATLAFAAPAAADEATYLHQTQPRLAYLSEAQLLSAAKVACSITQSGSNSANAVPAVSKHLGVSVSAASEIVAAAVVNFSC